MDNQTIFIIVFVLIGLLLIRKFLHILDKANQAEWDHRWVNRIDGFVRIFCSRFHRLPENYIPLPETGGAIIASNHISGLDPLLLVASSKRPLRFLIAREEYDRYGLRWLFKAAGCIPVDRFTNPEKALRQALLALDRGEVIAIFPQGGIQWPINDESPFRIKGGAVRLAIRKKVPLYPVVVDGVGLKGFTLLAVLKRSIAELSIDKKMHCESMSYEESMELLAQKLNRVS